MRTFTGEPSYSGSRDGRRRSRSHLAPERQAAGYRDWIAESFALRQQVYEIGDRRLGFEYQFRNLPVVELRLRQAGVRLAGVLNRALGPLPPPVPE